MKARTEDFLIGSTMILGFLLTVALILGGIGFAVHNALHEETRVCHVDSKERLPKSGGGFDQRVYTSDCGVLTVGDAMLAGHFNSADTWASIDKDGGTYRLTTRGYRMPFFSAFPNIIDAEEVSR